jgi:hypothetical protein
MLRGQGKSHVGTWRESGEFRALQTGKRSDTTVAAPEALTRSSTKRPTPFMGPHPGCHRLRVDTAVDAQSREGDLHAVDCGAYAGFIWEERTER